VKINPKNLAIFCKSFREVEPVGTVIIFINKPISEIHKTIAESTNTYLIEFDSKTLLPEYIRTYHPSSQRWILFDRLLSVYHYRLARTFNKVVVVDVRDTLFQTNPFDLIANNVKSMHVFGESRGLSIASCGKFIFSFISVPLFLC